MSGQLLYPMSGMVLAAAFAFVVAIAAWRGAHPVWLAEMDDEVEPHAKRRMNGKGVLPPKLQPWIWSQRNNVSLGIDLLIQRTRLVALRALDVDLATALRQESSSF